ncbi:transcription factor LHW isoform X2 [Populus alba x Populus x berolinensis]|uniref:Transcription factor LHW isoform X2 n=1 Tax=Populus alba x Populus x berolinensis TaxID=444605 RepID=A0AAD6RNP6_9ROSI|nr:transcription factor LHW isoform X2 [Populus alba x Populus x berolinensis]
MGLLLREVLKVLCGVNQWCYAVFWKIGCQNPKLLIWEECHYEPASCSVPPSTSGTENLALPFGEWEGHFGSDVHSSQLGIQAGGRLCSLINKMMVNNQVNIVGEGIVGRVAFTGNHEWILANNYSKDAHPPEVLNEVHHQFSAGMQTIAVIPVCPHGVLQLGSSLAILENIGFVNNVKSLILQLGCVPGALLSDNHMEKEPTERIGMPISCGMALPVCFSGTYKVPSSTPSLADSCNQQIISSQEASRIVGQPSCSQTGQVQDDQHATSSAIHIPNATGILTKSCDDFCEPKITSLMKPDNPFMGQLANGVVGAEVIPSNPGAWLNHQTASSNLRLGFNHRPIISQSNTNSSILKSLEQKIFSDVGAQNHVSHYKNESDGLTMAHPRTNEGHFLTSTGGSHISGQLPSEVGTKRRANSILCSLLKPQKLAGINHSSMLLAGVGTQNVGSSRAEDDHLSGLLDQSSASGILSGDSNLEYPHTDVKPTKTEATTMEKKIEGDLFQALNVPLTQSGDIVYLGENVLGSVNDCLMSASGSQNTVTLNAKRKEPCAQPPSGDDLYDILGVEFKNKLLNGKWNNLVGDKPCVKTQDIVKDTSTFMSIREANSDLFSLTGGVSDSNMFSDLGTDHLLDAVVSKVHSSAKQSSDDNVSCRTTLTKISMPSFPGGSPTYGRIGMSDQVQRELISLPKRAGTIASSSFRSGCSKDDVGTCSQTTSIYGSQLSSWVEQGHNARHDCSISTAFSKKNDETSKPNRKRLKAGENPRPRPKDRQMIQDRVKELREIVPNGAKCSIDALLERTIKHMLFLQSVTKHADKLKQTGDSKVSIAYTIYMYNLIHDNL